jgi:hypothetical protein
MIPTHAPPDSPLLAGVAPAGTQEMPFHRHRPSGDIAGRQAVPSHHQKPSSEKRIPVTA